MQNKRQIKGVIKCPICGKGKTIVYNGATGEVSIKCGNCTKFILYDFEKMTAICIQPEKWTTLNSGFAD